MGEIIKRWFANNKIMTMTIISYLVVSMILTAMCLEIGTLNIQLSEGKISLEVFERMKTNIYAQLNGLITLVMIFYFSQRDPNPKQKTDEK